MVLKIGDKVTVKWLPKENTYEIVDIYQSVKNGHELYKIDGLAPYFCKEHLTLIKAE